MNMRHLVWIVAVVLLGFVPVVSAQGNLVTKETEDSVLEVWMGFNPGELETEEEE